MYTNIIWIMDGHILQVSIYCVKDKFPGGRKYFYKLCKVVNTSYQGDS